MTQMQMGRWRWLFGAVVFGVLACQPLRGESLEAIVDVVSRKFDVREIEGDAVADSMAQGRLVLFDVREREEFEVGHLQTALRVDPDIGTEAFLVAYGDTLAGRMAVFYCSVGYRSSALAERVASSSDSLRVLNLRGGIFKWYNDGREVVDSTGVTDQVHPYSDFWGRLLEVREGRSGDE